MRRWRERHLRARRPDRHAERRDPAAAARRARKIVELEWGADTERFQPGRGRRRCRSRGRPATVAVFAGAFRSWHGAIHLVARDARAARARPSRTVGAVFDRRRPGAAARAGTRRAGLDSVVFTGAVPHDADAGVPGRGRHRRRAVRRRRARAARARLLLVAAEDLRVHGGRPAGRRAGARPRSRRSSAHGREGAALRSAATRAALADALERADAIAPLRQRLGRRGARRAPCASTAGRRTAARSTRRIRQAQRAAREDVRMNVLLVTDAFPPVCGGSGWSTYELARGLRARGHDVTIVQPRPGHAGGRARDAPTTASASLEFGAPAPPHAVRPQLLQERAALRAARRRPRRRSSRASAIDIVHGQHVLTSPAGDRRRRTRRHPGRLHGARLLAGVLLVRSDPHARRGASLCPGCSAAMMTRCIRPRAGALWPLALPMIPYMRAQPRAQAHAAWRAPTRSIAVSTTIAADLRARAPELAATRLEIIPNPVDIAGLRRTRPRPTPPLPGPYALYLGKLAPNKGTSHLVRRRRARRPRLAAGRSSATARIATRSQPRPRASRRDIRLIGWVDQARRPAWLAHAVDADLPVARPRVAEPRAARGQRARRADRRDEHRRHARHRRRTGRPGCCPTRPRRWPPTCARLRQDEALRRRLGAAAHGARRRARSTPPPSIARIEQLYRELHREAARVTRADPRRRRRALGLSAARPRRPRAARLRPGALPGRRGRRASRSITRPPAPGRRRTCATTPSIRASRSITVPYRTFPVRRPARHDGDRSQHGVSAVRRARRARRAGELVRRRRDRHRPRPRRQRARLCAAARARVAAPLVLNPQGLEEFGATDPGAGAAEARRLSAAAARGARVRARRRSRHRHRPRARAGPCAQHLSVPADAIGIIPNALDLRCARSRWRPPPTARASGARPASADDESCC